MPTKDKNNIDMRDFIPNKKRHNSNYFKTIDSETKAYILGYIVADGSIEESVRKDRPSKLVRLRFGCVSEDDEIIKITRELIATDEPISTSTLTYNVSPTGIMKLATKEVIKWSYPELPKEVEETKDSDNVETVTAEVVGVGVVK